MPYAAVNGLRLYYEEEGSGPPLVLLNGAYGTLDGEVRGGWGTLRPFLAPRFRVVHVEARGHGRTDNPGGADAYTLPTLAADVAALIEQLGLAPAHVAGFSHGALVGLELAVAHPGGAQRRRHRRQLHDRRQDPRRAPGAGPRPPRAGGSGVGGRPRRLPRPAPRAGPLARPAARGHRRRSPRPGRTRSTIWRASPCPRCGSPARTTPGSSWTST